MFLGEVVPLDVVQKTFVSDREPHLASTIWGQIGSWMGIDQQMATAFYPQTDGQTGHMNAGTEQSLQLFVSH